MTFKRQNQLSRSCFVVVLGALRGISSRGRRFPQHLQYFDAPVFSFFLLQLVVRLLCLLKACSVEDTPVRFRIFCFVVRSCRAWWSLGPFDLFEGGAALFGHRKKSTTFSWNIHDFEAFLKSWHTETIGKGMGKAQFNSIANQHSLWPPAAALCRIDRDRFTEIQNEAGMKPD